MCRRRGGLAQNGKSRSGRNISINIKPPLEHGKDSFATMMKNIRKHGEEMCRAKNINFECSLRNTCLVKEPGMYVRQHIYLFAKEALNNAVKYADSSMIKFEASIVKDTLKRLIEGNGYELDIAGTSSGNGIINRQQRADEIRQYLQCIQKMANVQR